MSTDPAPGFSEARDEQLINSLQTNPTYLYAQVACKNAGHPSTSHKQHIFSFSI